MTKLKTLKDIDKWKDGREKNVYEYEEDIRQEAINDIKTFTKQSFITNPNLTDKDLANCTAAVNAYIKWKNNLTEKDLK